MENPEPIAKNVGPRFTAIPHTQWQVTHVRDLEEENRLIEAGFEYIRYSQKDEVAIYRKRK